MSVVKNKPQTVLLAANPESGEKIALMDIAASLCGNEFNICSECRKYETDREHECPVLSRVLGGKHPDVIIFRGTETGKRKAHLRDIIADEAITPMEAPFKAYVLSAFDSYTEDQQNVLLKTLEEPTGSNRFYIIASNTSKLLDTIKSRAVGFKSITFDEKTIYDMLISRGVSKAFASFAAMMSDSDLGKAEEYVQRGEEFFAKGIAFAEDLSSFILAERPAALFEHLYEGQNRISRQGLLDARLFWLAYIRELFLDRDTDIFRESSCNTRKCRSVLTKADCCVLMNYLFSMEPLLEVYTSPALIADGFANEIVRCIRK